MAIDDLIDVPGRASEEAVLELSARHVAAFPGRLRRATSIWCGMEVDLAACV
jgi:hypothetical protein